MIGCPRSSHCGTQVLAIDRVGFAVVELQDAAIAKEVVEVVSGHRVLIVDDDPAYIKSTQLVLESHGYEVDTAASGDEALSKMRTQRPDLVLLDIMMDWALDGVNVTRQMLRDRELQGVPVIIVSSIVDSEYRDMFPQDEYLHCDYWLDKPCPPSVLVSKIETVLSRFERDAQATA